MDTRLWIALVLLITADVTLGATARGVRVNVIGRGEAGAGAGAGARGRLARVRLADTTPANTWPNILTDYGQPSGAFQPNANLFSQLSRAISSGVDGAQAYGGGLMAMPFLVLPVKTTQECPVSQDGISASRYDYSKQGEAPLRPAAQMFPRVAQTSSVRQQRPDQLPYVDIVESSQRLVELFREQQPTNPELPPAVIPDYGDAQAAAGYEATQKLLSDAGDGYTYQGGSSAVPPIRKVVQVQRRKAPEAPLPSPSATPFTAAPAVATPPQPRFQRSLVMRGKLTVPRADYSEPYTVWWDAESGGARVDLHGGATSTYRLITPNGLVQGIEVKVDRTGETEVIRCGVTSPRPPQPADRALPALPDLNLFNFAGYLNSEAGRVEKWTHTVVGRPGEKGGARAEALTFKHELLLARGLDNDSVVPLRYSVAVDSSVLGEDCDGYTHVYSDFREVIIHPSILKVDIDGACDSISPTEQVERVEPLKEFTLPHRDPRYDDVLLRFVTEHTRQYSDDPEWAVRKNLIMQTSRFVASANRLGATFETGLNFFGDRLQVELEPLSGVNFTEVEAAVGPEDQGSIRRGRQAVAGRRLPARFDWRELGGVTNVRFQGFTCLSCWAFAVTGAVEGALFAKTGALVPLSEQCLVDCAQPYGARGCKGTWPAAAYNYIQDRGLRALNEYVEYKEKVLQCVDRQVEPVTHIRGHVNVTKFSVRALKRAIMEESPAVVVIDSRCKSFVTYSKGVIQDDRCMKRRKLDHAVLAVGFDEHRKEPHFIIKNSWSAKWGDGGYARIHGPSNTCGVLTWPSYPVLERPDVDRQLGGQISG